MRLRSLTQLRNLRGKRVIVRIDADVSLKDGRVIVGQDIRLSRACETILYLLRRGVSLILLGHVGRPHGRVDDLLRMRPIWERLGVLLEMDLFAPYSKILPMENVRFDPREEKNDFGFAKELVTRADAYVNDAFAVSHRAHTSVAAIQQLLPSYAGLELFHEVTELTRVIQAKEKPFVLILGGAKVKTKMRVLQALIKNTDMLVCGGVLANTFLAAMGEMIGKSMFEKDELTTAQGLFRRFGKKILLPVDVVVEGSDGNARVCPVGEIKSGEKIVNIGPRSLRQFIRSFHQAKMIVWNGPLGMCEVDKFCTSTQLLARAIAAGHAKIKVVGGGDTIPIIQREGFTDRFTFVSTGGGAMLAFLAGEKMPGLEPLKQVSQRKSS